MSSSEQQLAYFCHQCNFITACRTDSDNELHCVVCNGTYIEQRDNVHNANNTNTNSNNNATNATQQFTRRTGYTQPFAHMQPFNPFNMIQSMVQSFIAPSTQQLSGDYYFGDMNSLMAHLMQHEHQRQYGTPPASQQAIDALTHTTITTDHTEKHLECTVCLSEFELGDTVTALPCKHLFHDQCIRDWLKLHSTCCTCRKSIEPEQTQTHNDTQQQYTRRGNIPHV